MSNYNFCLSVEVTDPNALYSAAFAAATQGRGALRQEEALIWLGTPQDPKIGNCIRFFLDKSTPPPGTATMDSSCEEGV